jgi:hypothetical protein
MDRLELCMHIFSIEENKILKIVGNPNQMILPSFLFIFSLVIEKGPILNVDSM